MTTDRRKNQRYDATMNVKIRFMADGTPIEGSGVDIGPNGMRLVTMIPLVEASYVNISFENASNNTHCEGRVVWTQRSKDSVHFESGIDIQRWGGDTPTDNAINNFPLNQPKKDRRRTRR